MFRHFPNLLLGRALFAMSTTHPEHCKNVGLYALSFAPLLFHSQQKDAAAIPHAEREIK